MDPLLVRERLSVASQNGMGTTRGLRFDRLYAFSFFTASSLLEVSVSKGNGIVYDSGRYATVT